MYVFGIHLSIWQISLTWCNVDLVPLLGVDDLVEVGDPGPERGGAVQQVVLPHPQKRLVLLVRFKRARGGALFEVLVPGEQGAHVVEAKVLHVLDDEPALGEGGQELRGGEVAVGEDVLVDPLVGLELDRAPVGDGLDEGQPAGLEHARHDLVVLVQVLQADMLDHADRHDPDSEAIYSIIIIIIIFALLATRFTDFVGLLVDCFLNYPRSLSLRLGLKRETSKYARNSSPEFLNRPI